MTYQVRMCSSLISSHLEKGTLMELQEMMALVQVYCLFPPKKYVPTFPFMLTQLCSNNMVKYQPLILCLQMAIEMGIKELNIYSDS